MKPDTDKFDAPQSAFYRGKGHGRPGRSKSFRPTHETQRKLEYQRYRKERKSK